jgi:PAS domain S-box-containing protein
MARKAEARCEPQGLESGLGVARAPDAAGPRDARTRAMLEEIDEAFFALDWEYRYVHANQAALRVAGRPLEELLGRTPWEVFPQLQGSLLAEHYREAMELGLPSVFEHRSVASGDWLEIRIYPTSAGVSAYYREINERKQVEQELHRSRERERFLADVVEKAAVPFGVGAPDGRLIFFNQAFADLTGYSREELEEKALTWAADLTPPEWREMESALLAEAVKERRVVSYEKEYQRKDGSRVPIELVVQPVFDDDGNLLHYRSFLNDTSERQRTQAALRESEERFRSLFEGMTEGVVLHEVIYQDGRAVDYRILDVNPSFERQTGLAAQGARGRLASELYGTGDAPYLSEYAQVAESGQPYSFESYFEPMERHFRITAISPARGRFATVFEDITERKRVEEALRDAEAKSKDLIRYAPTGIYEIDFRGPTFKTVNDAMCALTGFEREELLAMNPPDLLDPESQTVFADRIRGRLAGEPIPDNVEYRVKTKDGRFLDVILNVSFTRTGGVIDGALVVGYDITERKQADREREQLIEELARSSERARFLAEVVEKADMPFSTREPDGRLVVFNQAFAELTGYSRAELEEGASTLAVELTPPDWWEAETPLLAQAVAKRQPVRFEKEYVRKDGSRVPIEVFAQPVFDDAGALVQYRSFLTDITERKRFEEALQQGAQAARQAEERYRNLFDTLIEGFCVIEMVFDASDKPVDYRFLEINSVFEERTGLHDAQGKLMRDLAPDHEEHWFEIYGKVALTGEPTRFMAPATALGRYYDVSAFRVGEPESKQVGILFNDITARHGAEVDRQRLLEESQTQTEELQSQNEELQVQSEELHAQTDELRAHSADLAERSRLAEALNDIGELIHSTRDFDDIMQGALEQGVQTLGVDAGAIEMRDETGWIVRYQCGFSAEDVGLRLSNDEAPSASLAERRRETLTVGDMAADETVNAGFVKAHSLKSVVAAPLMVKAAVVGCLLFYGLQARAFDEGEIDFGRKLGVTVSLAIENARLIEDEREATHLSTALNEINRLIHGTLNADEIMQRVVAEAVKAVHADSAMIALKRGEDWVAEYGYPPIPGVIHESVSTDEAPFVVTAATTRLPVAIDDCATDPRCVPEVQGRFGVRSVLCIPLIVREEVIGVVFFNHHAEAVKFEPRTVDFAGKLAAAISAALENAQLYAAQQSIAVTLQENFIHPLPQIAGLELASESATAFQPDLVGGDFHDAFELPDGRVLLLIGDVMGKGVKAAGLTETARTAVRAVALSSPLPQDILPSVNRVLMHETDQLVTVFLVLLDVKTGEALLSSAGHPPPVHLSAAGGTLIDTDFGPPLGAFEYVYTAGRLSLAPGDALVLYTDGVTEARRRGEFFGEAGLLGALKSAGDRSPRLLVDALRDAVDGFADHLADDLNILALRLLS